VAAGVDAVDARRMAEEAGGSLDAEVTDVARGRFETMVARRVAGEPLQYVLGSWGFRSLDLLVDRRVLIPRPETEWVVEVALGLLPAVGEVAVVDLGTGSGAIGLSIAAERWPQASVLLTDSSADALAVARANLAGLGRRGTQVSLAAGSWWSAVPGTWRGSIDLVVSNPPYVAPDDPLPAEVADWEPSDALVPGPTGLEALAVILGGAGEWLHPGGWVVCEIGESQGASARELAVAASLVDVEVRQDLTGRDRMVVGRRPA
jgi:release factor glutamine methyltransferase